VWKANELLAFLLEVVALGALCYWGFVVGPDVALKVVLGLGAPVVAAVVWGLFAAPRARVKLPLAGVLVVKAVVFGAAAVALWAAGQPVLGVVFAVLAVANTAVATIGRRRNGGFTP
jgi:hypothetical protein